MGTIAIILAAGRGTRMHSDLPKVLHKVCDKEMVRWVIDAMNTEKKETVLVVGYQAQSVQDALGDGYQYVLQKEQLGTGHAVMQAMDYLGNPEDIVFVAAGDMPLIQKKNIAQMENILQDENCAGVLLCTNLPKPTGFGRVILDDKNANEVVAIVEERDATEEQRKITCVNSSVYCFRSDALKEALQHITNVNEQNEYYLTDCIAYLQSQNKRVLCLETLPEDLLGVNTLLDLTNVNRAGQRRIQEHLMSAGVQIISTETTFIGADCTIEAGVTIYPNNVIENNVSIETGTVLYPGNFLEAGQIGRNCKIGPNAHIRAGVTLGNNCRVGNFVELKNITLKDGAKVSHLAYCGDGEIGERANISCGAIFSNYDGGIKNKTIVGDDAFVGCNANLVAPVTIEDGAYVAAGSTVTENVPKDALAIARARQINKENWNWQKRIKKNK